MQFGSYRQNYLVYCVERSMGEKGYAGEMYSSSVV